MLELFATGAIVLWIYTIIVAMGRREQHLVALHSFNTWADNEDYHFQRKQEIWKENGLI